MNRLTIISLFILGVSFAFLGSCKKDETKITDDKEVVDIPYQSIRQKGYTANKIKVVLHYNGNDGDSCSGYFMRVRGVDSLVDKGVNLYKIIGQVPESVKIRDNYGNTEWLVDVTYLGIGIECYITAQFSDPVPGGKVYSDDIELVEVTNYELYP